MSIWKVIALLESGYLIGNREYHRRFASYRHYRGMGIKETLSDIICRKLNYIFLGTDDPYANEGRTRPGTPVSYNSYSVNPFVTRSIRYDDIPCEIDDNDDNDESEVDDTLMTPRSNNKAN